MNETQPHDEILNQVRHLIESKMGKYKFPLDRHVMIESDLGITGEDAVELLIEYGQKFKVDLSGFKINKYFEPEGDFILPAIIRFLTGKKKPKCRELTIGDLEKGIIAGKLDEQVLHPEQTN